VAASQLWGVPKSSRATEFGREARSHRRIGEAPPDEELTFLAMRERMASNAARSTEIVHRVQALAQTAARDGDLNVMREVALDCFA
jgi:hypothetical protein